MKIYKCRLCSYECTVKDMVKEHVVDGHVDSLIKEVDKKMVRKMTKEVKEAIIKWYNRGYTCKDIAWIVDRSYSATYNVVHGYKYRERGRRGDGDE